MDDLIAQTRDALKALFEAGKRHDPDDWDGEPAMCQAMDALNAWNARQSADLIGSMSDVERKGEQSYEIDCPKCGAEAHQLCSLDDGTPLPAMHGARRLSPRQEGVTQADLKAVSEYAQFRVDNEHELAKAFAAHRRAAIASMDPVRQVAMQLREALRMVDDYYGYSDLSVEE